MAEAALATPSFDPVAAASTLNASQQAVRAASQPTGRPAGEVIRFPTERTRPPGTHANNIPAGGGNVIQFAPAEDLQETPTVILEGERQSQLQAARQAALQSAMPAALPDEAQEMLAESTDMQNDPNVQSAIGDYQSGMAALQGGAAVLQGGGSLTDAAKGAAESMVRAQIDKQIENIKAQLKKKLNEMMKKKFQEYAARYGKDWVWRIGSDGSVVEIEGAASWIWYVPGGLVALYRSGKTVLMPEANSGLNPTTSDPERGQLFKGLLSFAEPTALDLKDPFTWVSDIWYAILWWFIVVILFAVVQLILVILGFWGMIFTVGVDALGSAGEWIASAFLL